MRIRNAAIAGATAIAVAFGGTTVASAQSSQNTTAPSATATPTETASADYPGIFGSSNTTNEGTVSSKIGDNLNQQDPANGQAIFGSSKTENDGTATLAGQPAWAKLLYAATIIGGIASVVGTIVGPVYNYIFHGPHHF